MKDVWTRTFGFTSFAWLNTRDHTRAWAPAPLTWKYNLSMGVVSDKQHVGVMASSSHYTPILEHYSTRLKSIGFQLRIIIATHGVLNMSIILFRFPHNRVSHSHQNVIIFIIKMYSECAYLQTHFSNYLSRKYIKKLRARSSRERRSRYRARAALLHAMVRATPAEFLCAGT